MNGIYVLIQLEKKLFHMHYLSYSPKPKGSKKILTEISHYVLLASDISPLQEN